MTEESGQYPKLRGPREWRMPIGWSLLVAVAGSILAYGVGTGQNSQRMTELERHSQEQSVRLDAQAAQLAGHEVKIAVISEKLDTIIVQLNAVNVKLERAEQERK